ncbi:MAG TPA: histidine kinase [Verrucomicrobiae bacterium]|nr:histidine kinase [Verrucomicrobiae bacterium]
MNRKLGQLSRQYWTALRKHLKQGPRASLQPAQNLGRRAINLELETLDLVRIHERTLLQLVAPSDSPASRGAVVRRAGNFFAAAITPIEELHRTAIETNQRLEQLTQALCQRSMDLAASNQRLKAETEQRRLAEESLKKSEQHYGRLLEHSRNMQEQLRLLSRQLLSAQEEERKKISRELHDVIAQTLTSINVRLAALRKEATLNTKGIERSIELTQQLVERSVKIVHRFARELRPTVLDDLGLIPALHSYLKNFRAETGIRVTLSALAAAEKVNGDKRTALFRVAQEALANVSRHAHATQAEVKFQILDGTLCMQIMDNGKGFLQECVVRGNKSKRLGLLGMKERLEMVGGNFVVTSALGKGTTILAQIPLKDRNRPPPRGGRRS